jgi:hypothetical protein
VTDPSAHSPTLRALADTYEDESRRLSVSQKRRWAMQATADLFRRMTCNREAANPNQLTIRWSTLVDIPGRWSRQHGYRCVPGFGGYTLQCGHEPAIIAQPGDTLHWDGTRITVDGTC